MRARAADVIVVGSGNAAFAAALTAAEEGASVLMLEKGSQEWVGGNSWFTAGAYRLTHGGPAELTTLVDEPMNDVELGPYTRDDFAADMRRVTRDRSDPVLSDLLVTEARDGAEWMKRQGVRWRLMPERQAHGTGRRLRFWGGLSVGCVGGGEGLIDAYLTAAQEADIELRVESPVVDLRVVDGRVTGVVVRAEGGIEAIEASAVVLASGGFEASPSLRSQHLGPQWVNARVRGTPHNTGDLLTAALGIGAQPYGHWNGCHSIAWDAGAPPHGDRAVSNRFSRQAYPYGLVVNVNGERFVDEGADFRNYTYAVYGAEVLKQPSGLAFQIFDETTLPLLSPIDYSSAQTSRYEARSIDELATLAGIDRAGLVATVTAFNAAVNGAPFDPTILDGRAALDVTPPKSNWAQALGAPPYVAYAVVCGITFTFGGLRISPEGAVIGAVGHPIPGLFAAGEIVGGLFYHNYPGGSGLASGTVFGRRAGRSAAGWSRTLKSVESQAHQPH